MFCQVLTIDACGQALRCRQQVVFRKSAHLLSYRVSYSTYFVLFVFPDAQRSRKRRLRQRHGSQLESTNEDGDTLHDAMLSDSPIIDDGGRNFVRL